VPEVNAESTSRPEIACNISLRSGADKSLAFPIFLFAAQPKEFFLDGLKLEQRSHKCVELRGEYLLTYVRS
jgi:hypothetical protein